MILKLESNTLQDYLSCTAIIDFDHQDIKEEALRRAKGSGSQLETIRSCYEFVRDGIGHSADIEGKTVTCKASEVLKECEGLCYAKSHLLVALLRGNNIPAGFCYQLLRSSLTPEAPLVLHGLVGVFVENAKKWVRLDPRGNTGGINAQFTIEGERLAYQVIPEHGEIDFPIVFVAPDDSVITALTTHRRLDDLWQNLPRYPAKMEWCRALDAKLAREARLGTNPIGYCGHHCGYCFLGRWCGGCRSSYNNCSYATICEDGKCPNIRCAEERKLGGCSECTELVGCRKGYYEKDDEYIAKASALFIQRYGEERYTSALQQAMQCGINYPETYDSSGSVENALAILKKFDSL